MSRIAHSALRPSLTPVGESAMSKFPTNMDDNTAMRVETSFVELMEQCWNHNPANRPAFPEIVFKLERIRQVHESASTRSL